MLSDFFQHPVNQIDHKMDQKGFTSHKDKLVGVLEIFWMEVKRIS